MQKKEINEIRKIIRPDQSRLDTIYTYYINAEGEIIFEDAFAYGLLTIREKDLYDEIFKKTLSGSLEKNLLNLEFTGKYETNSQQELFYQISKNNEETDINKLVEKIRGTYQTDGNYAIILGHGVYDVVEKAQDGSYSGDSEETYSFFILAICPTASPKAKLIYDQEERKFSESENKSTVKAPDFGLLYPSFTDRQAHIYECLYYVKNNSKRDEAFEEEILACTMPSKVDYQQDYYKILVEESLEDKKTIKNLVSLNDKLKEMSEEAKESETIPTLEKEEIKEILESLGGKEVEIEEGTKLIVDNILAKDYKLVSDTGIKITIPEDEITSIKEEKIDGKSYILIPATGMDLNGIKLSKSLEF